MGSFFAWAAAVVAFAAAPPAPAPAPVPVPARANDASYVGAARCKLCHREVYLSWAKTPHARAIDAVPPADEIGDEERARCSNCHATRGARFPSVQCEACHGAGSAYAAPEVMIDPEKAAMAGLIRPSIGICERCHENQEPAHKGKLEMPLSSEWGRFIHEIASRE